LDDSGEPRGSELIEPVEPVEKVHHVVAMQRALQAPTLTDSTTKTAVNAAAMATHHGSRVRSQASPMRSVESV
jgi:hypothetical protein